MLADEKGPAPLQLPEIEILNGQNYHSKVKEKAWKTRGFLEKGLPLLFDTPGLEQVKSRERRGKL